jgi:outer membrane protein assembly factor BamB
VRVLARLLLIALGTLAATHAAFAADWPQFRGPDGQGHSTERNLPADWSETKNVVWKTRVPGFGWSSPVVADGRVWLTSALGDDTVSLRALAFDTETGREVVNVEVFRLRRPRDINPKNSYASPTPVIAGDRVFVHFGADGTAALTMAGEIVWKTTLPYESQHGAGGSPIVHGEALILSGDGHDRAFIVALETASGKVKWKTNRRSPFDQAYSTPLVVRVGDRDQIVSVGAYRAAAYDPETGREIWRVQYRDGFSNVPRPVYGHGLVFMATGFQQPSLIAVRPDGTGDVTKTHVAWTLSRGAPLTPSPLLVGDELYVINDGGILTCADARTGAIHWQMRLGGMYSASPVYADGRIYLLGEHGGAMTIAPGREFRRVGTGTLDGAMLASMAVAEGSLFIRTDSHLYRIAAAASSAGSLRGDQP